MYDPTFELTRREYGPYPEPDEFQELLSIGCEPDEAAAILDADILDFESWNEIYSESEIEEEVTPENYSVLVVI